MFAIAAAALGSVNACVRLVNVVLASLCAEFIVASHTFSGMH